MNDKLLSMLILLKSGIRINFEGEAGKDFFNSLYDAYFNMELGELLEEAQAIP
jgi:hypothetical protein